MLDTSNNYGEGRSEARIGAAIRERGGLPQGFVISTKVDREPATNRLTAARVRQSLNESLAALGVDRVQILHLHDPEFCADLTDITQACGALDELFKMKAEGMVELLDPKPLEQLLREVTDHETAQQFYLASRAAVAGDSRTDKSYIAFLRDRLKLDEVEAAEVEQLTR